MQHDVSLPIDPYIPELVRACRTHASVIVRAEPGAGKTTRLPIALLNEVPGRILVLEPRRIAARLSAERVAREVGEPVGRTVGYHMRFAAEFTVETRLIYITEGIFLRLLQDNPNLDGISAVFLDEFHERHIHSDVALALIVQIQQKIRPDLRLIVMSATIDTELIANHLAPARVFDIPGRTFPVAIEYLPDLAQLPIDTAVLEATRKLLHDARSPGNILVFLTGIQEIRRCQERLTPLTQTHDIEVFGLTAEMPIAEQNRIFGTQSRRMVVLATNVAETSVTLPNITGVIDTGRAKISGMTPWSGMPTLDIKPISQASATQRAGRAGRTAPGVAYRLFSELDFRARPAFLSPEIQRLDLAGLCLDVLAMCEKWGQLYTSVADALPWLESPDTRKILQSMRLLQDLYAVDADGRLTAAGRQMARLPLHPRLAKIVLKGRATPFARDAILIAALVSEGFIVERSARHHDQGEVDFKDQLSILYGELQQQGGGRISHRRPLPVWISAQRVKQVLTIFRSLLGRGEDRPQVMPPLDDLSLGRILLAGFPDRVAKLRPTPKDAKSSGKDGLTYNLVTGGGGVLTPRSSAKSSPWIVVIEAEESTLKSADQAVQIRIAFPLEASLLSQDENPYTSIRTEAVWADDAQRVDMMERAFYGPLVVNEARLPVNERFESQIQNLLLTKLREHWPKPFPDDQDLKTYHARIGLLSSCGKTELTAFEDEMLELLQSEICSGKRSFREIGTHSLHYYIDSQLSWDERQLLDRYAPLMLKLENGRNFHVHYDASRSPYLIGHIQDFFGVKRTPSILDGRIAVTLELTGPNKRPLQVTSDLEGFWQRDYPKIRSELGRTYPRHYWPEDPRQAEPHLHKSKANAVRP
jgi:ATP-dependent helicase HrpB